MTRIDKRKINEALESIHGNVEAIKTYLAYPALEMEHLEEMHVWATECLGDLRGAVAEGRDDLEVEWDTFASLVWTKVEVSRVCEALEALLNEPRTD